MKWLLAISVCLFAAEAQAWRAEVIPFPEKVLTVETVGGNALIRTRERWRRVVVIGGKISLEPASTPMIPAVPANGLPDGKVVVTTGPLARVYFAAPTKRYKHGVLGDLFEAEELVIEQGDGQRHAVHAGADAVFEDLLPRLADLDGDGQLEILVVKSYLDRGSALAVIGRDAGGAYRIIAETPPLGAPRRWLNPAGVADFNGDGLLDIALVRMPHALGRLELWGWRKGKLLKLAEAADASNHAIGSRALEQSAIADFDGDGIADLAIPSLDRRAVRLIAFRGGVREIARVLLPAAVATNFARIEDQPRKPILVLGLVNGALVAIRD